MKAGTNFDIARSNHTLKDIVDITDTPDIDMWNKMEKQIDKGKKGSVDIIIKKRSRRRRRKANVTTSY
jgi:hypothetical protein